MSATADDAIAEFETLLRQMSDSNFQSEELVEVVERFYEIMAPGFYTEFRYWDYLRKFNHAELQGRRGIRNGLIESTGRADTDILIRVFN